MSVVIDRETKISPFKGEREAPVARSTPRMFEDLSQKELKAPLNISMQKYNKSDKIQRIKRI